MRIAVPGAGRIGRIQAANAADLPGATLVAVADPFGAAAATLAEEPSCEASLDAKRTAGRDDADAVAIGTPTVAV